MKAKSRPNPSRLWLVAAAVVIAGTALAFGYHMRAGAGEAPLPRAAHIDSWHENGAGGRYMLRLIDGRLGTTTHGIRGTVMTDSNCKPDANGLSHCHNVIELADGSRITVVNSHQMNRYRCLQPGEPIWLQSTGGSWLRGKVSTL